MKKQHKIDDTFQFEEKTLKVIDNPDKIKGNRCINCYFYDPCGACLEDEIIEIIGECEAGKRKDRKNIIFVEE